MKVKASGKSKYLFLIKNKIKTPGSTKRSKKKISTEVPKLKKTLNAFKVTKGAKSFKNEGLLGLTNLLSIPYKDKLRVSTFTGGAKSLKYNTPE
jgi:hypothetical protein